MSLDERVDAFARNLLEREARHADDLAGAEKKADELRATVAGAIDRFNAAVAGSLPNLRVEVSTPRLDDKHVHAFEFDLSRGRHRGIVTVKSKSEVTLVGPFRTGKNEGPCKTFPFSEVEALDAALADFVERFLEEATAP